MNRKRVQTPQTNANWHRHSPRLFVEAKGTQGQGRNAEIRPRAVAVVCAHAAGHVLPCECAAPVGPNHADRVAAARLCGVRGWRSCRRAASPPSGQPRSRRDDANTTDATTRQPKTRSWVVRCARRTERPRHHGTVVRRAWATLSLSNCVLDVRYIKGKKGNDGAIATGVITNDPTRRAPCGVASWRHSREDARHQRGLSYAVRIVVRVW